MQFRIRVAGGRLRSGDRQLANLRGEVIKSNGTMAADAPPTLTIPWSPAADFETDNALEVEEYKRALKERAIVQAKNQSRQAAYEALIENISRFRQRLQNLILRRRHFFTRVILNAIEPEEITQLLEALRIGHTDIANPNFGIPLGDIAHTIPLGMTTGAFVLKLKRLDEEDIRKLAQRLGMDREVEELEALLKYSNRTLAYFENAKRREATAQIDHVYAPTGGLFAEAILGRANSAEYLDMERYFNWQDSPIPHQPPAIQPVGTESRFQQGEVNVNVPEGNLQVINPVNLPDPTGLQGVLAAIQNPNLFRDMSKASELAGIIGNLSALAGQMGQAASTMTGQAAQQALQAATEASKAATGMAQSLMSEGFAQTGGTPSTITQQGAALNKQRELDQSDTGAGGGSSTGTTPSGDASAPASGGPRSSTSEDIVRKAAGLSPVFASASGAQGTSARPEESQLVTLLRSAVEKASSALATGLGKARANPDGKLEEALRGALIEAAKEELVQQGVAALPVGQAIKVGTQLALAFAVGVGVRGSTRSIRISGRDIANSNKKPILMRMD